MHLLHVRQKKYSINCWLTLLGSGLLRYTIRRIKLPLKREELKTKRILKILIERRVAV